MRRQTRIVVGFLDQVLRSRPLPIKPYDRVNGRILVSDEHPVAVFRCVEQLILFGFFPFLRLRLWFLLVAQSYEPVGFPPSFRLIGKLALAIGIGSWRTGPACGFQLLQQSWGLLRRQHEPAAMLLVRLHRLPTVQPRVGARITLLHTLGYGGKDSYQMLGDLFTRRALSFAQLAADVLPRLGQESQNWLIALLSAMLRVVSLARSHLAFSVHRLHGRVGIQSDFFQFHVSGLPNSLPHVSANLQQLPCHHQM